MNFFIKNQLKRLISLALLVYIALVGFGLTLSDKLIFLPQSPTYALSEQLLIVQTKNDSGSQHNIVAQYLENPSSKFTILYSHGNAVDLGGLQHLLQNFYSHGYSIIIYDYSGYGQSEGSASEQQVYNDVQAIYNYLTLHKKLNPEHIVSYGHSLGAAIATDLAVNNTLAGLILESPFTTAFTVKTIYPLVPFDKFASIDKIKNINPPIFITHSRDDPVIPFWHGKTLFDTANSPKKFLALENQGHSNITHSPQFWPALETFISTL